MNNIENRLVSYKELYAIELTRKSDFNERMKWLLSIWLIVIGSVIFCFQNYYKVNSELISIFHILMTLTIAVVLVTGVLLGSCFKSKGYAHIGIIGDIEGYISENSDESFDELMIELYSNAQENDYKVNNELLKKLVDSTHLMIFGAILILFCFLCFASNWIEKEEPVQKIEIIRGGE